MLSLTHAFPTGTTAATPSLTAALAHTIAAPPMVIMSQLSNGVRVATLKPSGNAMNGADPNQARAETGAVGVWVRAGSRFEVASPSESTKEHGAAHFLEHLAFKGTPSRPQEQLEREVEDAGAQLSAYTSREHTVFMGRCLADAASGDHHSLPKWMVSVLGDLVSNCDISERAVERERAVILREMTEVGKVDEEVLLDKLHLAAFGGGDEEGLGRSILGSEDAVKSLTREQIAQYKARMYGSGSGSHSDLLIVGVGPWKHSEFETWVRESALGKSKDGRKGGSMKLKPVSKWRGTADGARVHGVMPRSEVVGLGWKGFGWRDPMPMRTSAHVLHAITGRFDHLANGHGHGPLATIGERYMDLRSIAPFSIEYSDTGLDGVVIRGSKHEPESLWRAAESVWALWSHLAENELPEEELKEATLRLKCEMVSARDGLAAVCEDVGTQLAQTGVYLGMPQICKGFDDVTPESVRAAAQHSVQSGVVMSCL